MMIVRQRISAGASRVVSTRKLRPKPSSISTRLRSIATRTLAVAASFWLSPSHGMVSISAFEVQLVTVGRRTIEFNPIHRWQARTTSIIRRSMASTTDEGPTIHSIESTSHLPRLYVETISLVPKTLVPLTVDQEHYLLDVMRITNPKRWGKKPNAGEDVNDYTGCVRIFNGKDGEWLAQVVVADDEPKKRRRKGRDATVTTVVECQTLLRSQDSAATTTNITLELCFGYIRDKQRRRFVFEKATELGIDSIRILDTDFSNNAGDAYKNKNKDNWSEEDFEKHAKHVIEAAEQSERLSLPIIAEETLTIDVLAEAIESESEQDLWLVCRERSESSPPILSVLDDSTTTRANIYILIGPEGGWSPRELEVFGTLDVVKFVSLGPSVLRAETAAITAVASVQMHRESKSSCETHSSCSKGAK